MYLTNIPKYSQRSLAAKLFSNSEKILTKTRIVLRVIVALQIESLMRLTAISLFKYLTQKSDINHSLFFSHFDEHQKF